MLLGDCVLAGNGGGKVGNQQPWTSPSPVGLHSPGHPASGWGRGGALGPQVAPAHSFLPKPSPGEYAFPSKSPGGPSDYLSWAGSLPPERPAEGALVPIPSVGSLCLPIAWWARMCPACKQLPVRAVVDPWGHDSAQTPPSQWTRSSPHDATPTQRRTTAPGLRAPPSVWPGRPATPAPRSPEGSLHPTRGRGPCKRAMAQTVPAPCWLVLEMVF